MNFSPERIDRESQRLVGHAKPSFDLQVMSLTTLNQKQFEETAWLVQDLIPEDARIVFSGQPESYKSFIAQSIALAVAQGQPLFDHYATLQRRVLIIDLENHERLIKKRMQLLGAADTKNLLFSLNPDFSLEKQSCVDAVVQLIDQYAIKLVILDSLIRMHAAIEDNSVEMARVTKAITRIRDAGVTVIFIHHDKKSDASNQTAQSLRGSSEIRAAVDLQYGFKSDGSTITVQQLKNRLGMRLAPITVNLVSNPDHLQFIYQGAVTPQTIVEDAKLEKMVLETLFEEKHLNYAALLSKLITSGFSKHKAEQSIAQLRRNGTLQVLPSGNKNEKVYTLFNHPNTPNSLETGRLGVLPTSGEAPSSIADETSTQTTEAGGAAC